MLKMPNISTQHDLVIIWNNFSSIGNPNLELTGWFIYEIVVLFGSDSLHRDYTF